MTDTIYMKQNEAVEETSLFSFHLNCNVSYIKKRKETDEELVSDGP